MYQYPIFLVFLKLIKLYDNLDHGWLLKTLGGCREGPKIQGILAEF